MAGKTEYDRVHELLAKDPRCVKVTEPDATQVTLLPKAAVPVVRDALVKP